jgi:sigma-E factor negative regulatory protein RseB
MTPPASAEAPAAPRPRRPGVARTWPAYAKGLAGCCGQRRSRAWKSLFGAALCSVFANAVLAGQGSDDAQKSLDRMAKAAQTLNYDGTFVYRNGATMQSMRIIHRFGEEGERERLVALSGAAREVIRDRERVTCILPDRQSVVVAKSRQRQFPHSKLFQSGSGFARYYTLRVAGGERIAGRHTQLVTVEPHDRFRYGYRLWMDQDSGLLLKSELVDEHAEIVEQLVYTNIALPESIPDELLEPEISGAGYTWYGDEKDDSASPGSTAEPGWLPTWLPNGFELLDQARDPILSSRDPVEHLLFSDGLASLSIFIERLDTTSEPLDGLDNMGAMNAFGSMVDDLQITVVGEVPAATVERVAASVSRR